MLELLFGEQLMIKGVVENVKILYEMAPESHAHSYKSRGAGETLDLDA